jgi:hypothetical protein
MNNEIAQEVTRIEKIVSTVTGRDLRSNVRNHKNVISRLIFYKVAYDYLCKIGMERGAKSYVAKFIGKDHATALYALGRFKYDILGSPLNKKMYSKCVEVFESVGDVYSSVDERDLMIDELKNKITDLQLRLKDAKPYREEVEVLVELINQVPSEHIETAEFRILTMLKGFKIAPKNQETKVIGSYETVTSF